MVLCYVPTYFKDSINMPKVKITYFNLKGLAEGIRLLLTYGDQEFEDVRIERKDWPALKPTTPFGVLPFLEIDGKKYSQSSAIGRYLGKKYGLAGKDIEEDFEIDQILDFFNDIRIKAAAVFFETDEKIQVKKQEDLEKNYYPFVLKKLDDIIAKNNGHVALGKLTWADFIIGGCYPAFKKLIKISNFDEQYPNIKKPQEKLLAIPKLRAYCETAPVTEW
ncbi:unnamed protein product, partial [Brenthis ino]